MHGRIYYSHKEDRLKVDISNNMIVYKLGENDRMVSEFRFHLPEPHNKRKETLETQKFLGKYLKSRYSWYLYAVLECIVESFLNHAFTAEGIRYGTKVPEIEKFLAGYGLKIEIKPIENSPHQPVT